jgi:uncharacterized membrane protein
MIIDPQHELENLKTAGDKTADRITAFAGSLTFVVIHMVWFALWILMNLGVFGKGLRFDPFPFGLLTLIVSLEAIFLATFVMISQNRESAEADIRSRLDYETDVKAEKQICIVMETLTRIADKQNIDVKDLVQKMDDVQNGSTQQA